MNWRKERLRLGLGAFMRQYRRKREAGIDPNDRRYDREFEAQLKRLDPHELDDLLREEGDPP